MDPHGLQAECIAAVPAFIPHALLLPGLRFVPYDLLPDGVEVPTYANGACYVHSRASSRSIRDWVRRHQPNLRVIPLEDVNLGVLLGQRPGYHITHTPRISTTSCEDNTIMINPVVPHDMREYLLNAQAGLPLCYGDDRKRYFCEWAHSGVDGFEENCSQG
jgi:hypothetical protein